MPAMTAEDRARRRLDLAEMVTTEATLVTLARAPKGMTKHGGAEAFAVSVPMQIWATDGNSDPHVIQAVPDVGGARVSAVGYAPAGTDLQHGDEIWTATRIYKVVGVGAWNATVAVALYQVVPKLP